jgi:hypothetical protein
MEEIECSETSVSKIRRREIAQKKNTTFTTRQKLEIKKKSVPCQASFQTVLDSIFYTLIDHIHSGFEHK